MLLCPALPGNEPQLGVPSHASLPRLKLHTPPGSPGFAPHPAWRAGAGLGRPLELCGWNLPERCPTAAANLWSWTRPSRPRLELGFFFFFLCSPCPAHQPCVSPPASRPCPNWAVFIIAALKLGSALEFRRSAASSAPFGKGRDMPAGLGGGRETPGRVLDEEWGCVRVVTPLCLLLWVGTKAGDQAGSKPEQGLRCPGGAR